MVVNKKPPLAIKLTNGRRGHALTAGIVVHRSLPSVACYPDAGAKVRKDFIIPEQV